MRIAAVTPAQAQAAAKKYRAPGRLHIVAVGDARAVAEILGRKAPLEVFDADGRPLPSGR